MSFLTAAGSAVTVYSKWQAGKAAQQQGQLAQQQADALAGVASADGQNQAALIRKAGLRTMGAADAGFAGAGVAVGQGSAQEADRYIATTTEHDALTAILNGDRRARQLQVGGVMAGSQGDLIRANSYGSAMSTILAGGDMMLRANGWRTKLKPTVYTPAENNQALGSWDSGTSANFDYGTPGG